MHAFIHCNSLYANYGNLFRPDLKHKPMVVLSNKDGYVVALPSEAELLGIKMGVPFF